ATLGDVARTFGRATGNPIAQGFGEGAAAGMQLNTRRQAAARVQQQQQASEHRRVEQLARELGATHPDDVAAIANSIEHPPQGISSARMQQAHIANAALLRDMREREMTATHNAQAATARAAQVAGYGSFGQLAIAMAHEHLAQVNAVPTEQQSGTHSAMQATAPVNAASEAAGFTRYGPLRQWVTTPLDAVDPASGGITNFDMGMAGLLARVVGSESGSPSLWVEAVHDLRVAYPRWRSSVFAQFCCNALAPSEMSERALMAAIEQKLIEDPPLTPGAVRLPWQRRAPVQRS
ncbi:MAG: hypothetical protein HC853_08590, partial [Anaerolineae bacterium]|nr:hypothetical protein [Anaerolineae bacterium]